MSRWTRACSVAVLISLALAGCGQSSTPSGSASHTPLFEATSCPFTIGGGAFTKADVRCGYLVVPENRSVSTSRSIKLAVAVFKSPSSHPAADPLIYLEGGPGGATVASMGSSIAAGLMPGYVGNRDLILVDQRGTGLSQPALTCPEVDAAYYRTLGMTSAKWVRPASSAMGACHARWVKTGVHPAAYNTVENAADIADLGPALGYRQVDLYGGSYGSALAQQVMRDHPQGIRAVVMDAVVVPTYNMFTIQPRSFWHSLQRVFKSCAASLSCNAQYPHLEQTLIRVTSRLQAHPVTLKLSFPAKHRTYPVLLDAQEFLATIRWSLMFPQTLQVVPWFISDTDQGVYKLAVQLEQYFGFRQIGPYIGMTASMTCSGERAGVTLAMIAAAAKGLPAALRAPTIASYTQTLALCSAWPVPNARGVVHANFRTGIPTLLLPGGYDATNLPAQEIALAPYLSHGRVVFFPTLSHAVVGTGVCPDSIVSAFLGNPSGRLDASCAATLSTLWR